MTNTQESADVVYLNGKIYTVNYGQPWAEAFAIKDGNFYAVGNNEKIKKLIGENTETIDLEGKFVMPGMGDLHQHWDMSPLQEKQGWLFVEGKAPAPDELKKLILEYAEANPDEEWIIGRNGSWFDDMFTEAGVMPGCAWLDGFMKDRPVALQDMQGHIFMANTKAMELAGISRETPDPTNGIIGHDEDGNPNGLFADGAQTLIMRPWPVPAHSLYLETFSEQSEKMISCGLTMIRLVHSRRPALEAMRELDLKGKIFQWLDIFTSWKDDIYPVPEKWELIAGNLAYYATRHVNPFGMKWHHDGTAASGTALSLYPYADSTGIDVGPDGKGRANMTFEESVETYAYLDYFRLPTVAHCVADGSARMILDAVEKVRKRNGNKNVPHTMSHTYIVDPADYPRFKELNVIAEVATGFAWHNFGTESYVRRFGERIRPLLFPVKQLIEAGAIVVPGSDYTVGSSPRPLEFIENYITRKRPTHSISVFDETSDEPFGEGISLEQAMRIVTMNCAVAMGREEQTGSIEQGKSADFVILDQNLFEIEPSRISQTNVLNTVFEGNVIFTFDPEIEAAEPKEPMGCLCSFAIENETINPKTGG